jgi:hypothetical protein
MSYSSNGNRPKLSEKGLLTPDNCVVALIDHQGQMLFGTSNFDRQSIINNTVALGKASRPSLSSRSSNQTRLGFRLRSPVAIWQLRFREYPGMDFGIGNRLPVSHPSAETPIQRQGRHLQWRRSQDEYSRHVQSLVPQGQLFWCPRHHRSWSYQLYRRTPSR